MSRKIGMSLFLSYLFISNSKIIFEAFYIFYSISLFCSSSIPTQEKKSKEREWNSDDSHIDGFVLYLLYTVQQLCKKIGLSKNSTKNQERTKCWSGIYCLADAIMCRIESPAFLLHKPISAINMYPLRGHQGHQIHWRWWWSFIWRWRN